MNGSVREFLELGPKTVLDYTIEACGCCNGAEVYCAQDGCLGSVAVGTNRTLRSVLEEIEQHEKTHVLRHYTEVADET